MGLMKLSTRMNNQYFRGVDNAFKEIKLEKILEMKVKGKTPSNNIINVDIDA